MSFGVEEYFIISPNNKIIQIFTTKNDLVKSSVFEELSIEIAKIFD
ncbi:hypothetical protein [Clostridium caldaquaticum]|nr:hypothetical protein [Clostridium caldaquaticum]